MSYVKLVILLALSASCAIAAPLFSGKSDAFMQANSILLESKPGVETLLDNVKNAQDVLAQSKATDPQVVEVLKKFAALDGIAKMALDNKFDCVKSNIQLMHDITKSMEEHSKEDPYGARSGERLYLNVIDLQRRFGTACFEYYRRKYEGVQDQLDSEHRIKLMRHRDLVKPIKELDELRCGLNKLAAITINEAGKRLYSLEMPEVDQWRDSFVSMYKLEDHDSKIDFQPISFLKSFFEDKFLGTCNYIESKPDVVEVLEGTAQLANSLRPTDRMLYTIGPILTDLLDVTTGYLACKELKSVKVDDMVPKVSERLRKR